MKLKNSKRRKNGFTMVELLAVVAILGVIVAIAVPVSLSYVRNSRDKAFYLNVQEIVKKVKMENELNRARHCYYNVDATEASGIDEVSQDSISESALLSLMDFDKIQHLSILSYEGTDGKTKYAVLAQEKETGDWMDVLDFDSTTSEKTSWDNYGASYAISNLGGTISRENLSPQSDDIYNTFKTAEEGSTANVNQLSHYQADIEKCTLDFKEGN